MSEKSTSKNSDWNQDTFIIAEAGVNHNRNLKLAREMIDVALEAGADAVKFQTFRSGSLTTKGLSRAPYQRKSGDSSHYEMLEELELSYDDHIELKKHCDQLGIEFMSTPYDEESAKFLYQLGVKRMKVASADIIHRPLLECLGAIGLPVIQSTGMATIGEVDRAVRIFRSFGVKDITLLHCVSSYPLEPDQVNMQWMDCLRETFRLPTGYSDHTMGLEMPIMAVSLGAVVIEKHFTLDRRFSGPDHAASLEPSELGAMIRSIRNVEKARNDSSFGLADQESENVITMRRSLHAIRPIHVGQTITKEDIGVLRPGDGLDPWLIHDVIGKKARMNLDIDQPIIQETI